MKTRSRVEIITETTREISITYGGKRSIVSTVDVCGKCGGPLVPLNFAVRQSGYVWTKVLYLVDRQEVHSTETGNGEINICSWSLTKFKNKEFIDESTDED